MSNRTLALVALILLGIGYVAGRYLQPPEVKTKEVVKEVEKIKRDVVVVEKKVTRPDGTVVEEKITTDKSKIDTAKESTKIREESRRPDWVLGASALTDRSYQVSIDRRILGPIFLGVAGSTRGEVGVSVSMEF